ncbi:MULTISPECIES: AAA family ATPase [unclassified Arcicella]|uniref:AAA family ATPase n=1 Tax=unclassified Arcicella TaxID=2644986 RepID=UPI00286018F9|nr:MULTISPECIES: AAA family ATPase [unclassified Arcicella]MDR6563257.1 HTH-type transcriptional repressor of NAD biosynthesis genes [Arcicella sp. BE51]MDR6811592.1 HTH-type transcriptional repressor of NAD biosynthesis genes [Arcicella sp. BE140]MDR6823118.1 HTH-type transcriptional repressor of NAD biosynthesis genes [Arcicella sp. BE139]
MVKAFVFGKFLPFHKGHQAMINFALSKCDLLTVLVCCSDKENITGTVRKSWIEKTYTSQTNIEVKILDYLESELPNTSETSEEVSRIWAEVFKKQLPDYSLLITSEGYGNFVAKFMNIQHIAFDINRKEIPISATAVRNNMVDNWKYLPESVKLNLVTKVVILGTESTGKSTLTQKLAKYYRCGAVLEIGRDLIPNSNDFTFDDLHLVANEHARQIDTASVGSSPLLIIDTDIHTTKSYSKFTFGKELLISDKIYKSNKAHLYLYLNNDVEYFQDGTRLCETQRNLLDLSHRQILIDHDIDIVEIKGDWDKRFEKAVEQINKLMASNAIKQRFRTDFLIA